MWKTIWHHVVWKNSINYHQEFRPVWRLLIELSEAYNHSVWDFICGRVFHFMDFDNRWWNLDVKYNIPDLSNSVNSFLNQAWWQSGSVHSFWSKGVMLSLGVRIILAKLLYFPKSMRCIDKMSVLSLHSLSSLSVVEVLVVVNLLIWLICGKLYLQVM